MSAQLKAQLLMINRGLENSFKLHFFKEYLPKETQNAMDRDLELKKKADMYSATDDIATVRTQINELFEEYVASNMERERCRVY